MTSPSQPRLGVFDSGVGGLSVLRSLRAALPGHHLIYVADSGHAPYGERGNDHVAARAHTVSAWLISQRIDALVIACNTATAAAIAPLRAKYPGLPIVGVEPALRPAVATSQTGHIAVMATRSTLASAKFNALLGDLQGKAYFALQSCDGLASAIEQAADTGDMAAAAHLCARYLAALGGAGRFGSQPGQFDTLVLGCTHYPFASDCLQTLAGPRVRLIDTGPAVARQTARLLLAAGLLPTAAAAPGITRLVSTSEPARLQAAARRWLSEPAAVVELLFL